MLDPSARRAPRRARIAVGAAVVCFVAAVAVAAVLSAASAGGGVQETIGLDSAHGSGPDASAGDGAGGSGGRSGGAGGGEAGVQPNLLVHVLGAVVEPGLVELAPGARVVDAVSAAGGFTPEADPAGVNLARPVGDGEQLVVPKAGEVLPGAGGSGEAGSGAGSSAAAPADGLVHLNSAGLAELDTLPRIGPAMAQRILDWREANGGFTSVEQLREVAGIGDATFSGLVDLVAL
nr:helix-hairpin-helix domain-containing protein [Agromyces sp. LHK192]